MVFTIMSVLFASESDLGRARTKNKLKLILANKFFKVLKEKYISKNKLENSR